ncbi:hypothetical protein [Nocardia terpenica]|uniref:Uncharacterized protein n=1 Tax=Nocardia terpenica TaxID=455432 RepID=A0A164LCG3_9NOCA|nr:hypothetical protein [Nocardia terpenica]KZM72255.1 hypothetical protein AWN90_36890 [Nocardia terpenica]NQE86599.1 hypothetical protein [Nocardia terpenica]
MSAAATPVEEVVIRWSTTEQFEMRVSRAELLEMLAGDDELPDDLDELDDDAVSELFDSEVLAEEEGNEAGNYVATTDREIDEIEIVRPIPDQFAHLRVGHRIRVVQVLEEPRFESKRRIESVGSIIALGGSGLVLACGGGFAPTSVSWRDNVEITAVTDGIAEGKIVSAAWD